MVGTACSGRGTEARQNVLIPLKSGHGWHILSERTASGYARLNPFEIRAWLAHNTCGIGCYCYVLIPLKSGHGWHQTYVEENNLLQVLIPLKSGHGWHSILPDKCHPQRSLNPFEIRAWLARKYTDQSGVEKSLNPFEIRAWLAL